MGFEWTDPFHWLRAVEVSASGRRLDMMDMMRLQTDELSIPNRTLFPLLKNLEPDEDLVEVARQRLLNWDPILARESVEEVDGAQGMSAAKRRQMCLSDIG